MTDQEKIAKAKRIIKEKEDELHKVYKDLKEMEINQANKALKENAERVLESLKRSNSELLNCNEPEIEELLTPIYEFINETEAIYKNGKFVWKDKTLQAWDYRYKEQIEYYRIKQGYYDKNVLQPNPNTIGNTTAEVYGEYFLFKEYLEEEKSKLPIKGIGISGFNCKLSGPTIEGIHQQMTEKKYIEADLDSFKAVFGKGVVKEFRPVRWLIRTKRGKKEASKRALFVFLKRMLGKASNEMKTKAKVFFVDSKGKGIEIKTYPSPDEQEAVDEFDTIIGLPPLPDQKTKT